MVTDADGDLEDLAAWLEARNRQARARGVHLSNGRLKDERILGRIEGEEAVVSMIRSRAWKPRPGDAAPKPDVDAPITLAISPRDARRCCNELAAAIEYYEEDIMSRRGIDPGAEEADEQSRLMIVSLRRVGDQLDAFARAGGLGLGRDWWKRGE